LKVVLTHLKLGSKKLFLLDDQYEKCAQLRAHQLMSKLHTLFNLMAFLYHMRMCIRKLVLIDVGIRGVYAGKKAIYQSLRRTLALIVWT
jgi:hypothetical protein